MMYIYNAGGIFRTVTLQLAGVKRLSGTCSLNACCNDDDDVVEVLSFLN